MTVLMTEKWKCPRCPMPHNYRLTCDLCGYLNPDAVPEVEIDDSPPPRTPKEGVK